MRKFTGKRALVTGAASGIGRAIAMALAAEGVVLFLVDIDGARLEDSASEAAACGGLVKQHVCDLSNTSQVQTCAEACLAALGGVDILVNCAGVLSYGHRTAMVKENWKAALAVNLLAPVTLTLELLPSLEAQEESHIVNVCSLIGLVPSRKVPGYQTSKFGLVGFSLALRAECTGQNVGVTALCPGLVHTPMLAVFGPRWLQGTMSKNAYSPVSSPEHVARAAIAAIRDNRSIVVVSLGAKILWLLFRLFPRAFLWVVSRRFRLRPREDQFR